MTLARCYLVAVLWLQALLCHRAVQQLDAGLTAFLQLRLALLQDPAAAATAYCAARPPPRAPELKDGSCQLQLSWWRGGGREYELCRDRAGGGGGLGLAAPRRYHLVMACTFLRLGGLGLRLPLLSTTLFR